MINNKDVMWVYKIADLIELVNNNNEIFLYGAGNVCRGIVSLLEEHGLKSKVSRIFVTDDSNQSTHIRDICVYKYDAQCIDFRGPVVIAAANQHQNVILETLVKTGITNIVMLGSGFESDLNRELRLIKNKEKQYDFKLKKNNLINKISEVIHSGSSSNNYDILFFSPPYWDVYSPFSAVPCLFAKLQQSGYRCKQVDLGIMLFRYVLNKAWKVASADCLSEHYFEKNVRTFEKNTYETYKDFLEDMWFFNGDYFDIDKVKSCYFEMNDVQRCVIKSFYDNIYNLNLTEFDFERSENISKTIDETDFYDYVDFLCSEDVAPILECIPEVIGISITSTCQFLPGCFFSALIKKAAPDVKIIFGGSCADLFANSGFSDKSEITKYFDYIIIGEGETAITELMKYIIGNSEIIVDNIPNLMLFNEDGSYYFTNQIVEDVTLLPPPNYDGLMLDQYMSPNVILPYQTSRGCHYGYCAFCNHDSKYRHNYRSKDMKNVVNELLYLHRRYNVSYFQFVDEAIRPDCFEVMIDEMDKYHEFKTIKWFYYSRVSMYYNENILKKAKRNGCEMVMLGIETFNQRLLSFIKKGISEEASRYCLELFHNCHIKTFAWLMSNLPSESIEEAKADYNKVKGMHEYINAIAVGPFFLLPNTDMYKEPEKYNIIAINENDPARFMSTHDGIEVDKDAMLNFCNNDYSALRTQWCMTGDRYTLFFS